MAEDEHYFTADPSVPFRRVPVDIQVWGQKLTLTTGSGVFAQGRLDSGTAVLFRENQAPAGGRILDLGCGYGVIGLAIAAASPAATVTGIDVNERAVLLANENAEALGLVDRFHALTPDAVPTEATYDEIWSNPPIRIGKAALHELLLVWLPRLAPGGRAVMVVGKNLGADSLQRWLGEQGYPTTRLASAKGFRVLETGVSDRLSEALATADPLVRAATVRIERVPPRSPSAVAAVTAYFAELDARFPGGFDASDADDSGLAFVVATSDGRPVACGGVQSLSPEVGEIKRMWVHPDWRGAGLGSRLLRHLEALAAELGHGVVYLDTNNTLSEAIAMYERAGYRHIERYNDNPYAQAWFEKSLG